MDDKPFLKAICEYPDDDAPRLVYADWLEERGEADRAEFIRVQCEMKVVAGQVNDVRKKIESGRRGLSPPERLLRKSEKLRDRERALLLANHYRWLPNLRNNYHWVMGGGATAVCSRSATSPANWWEVCRAEFRRGFVESITCSKLAVFLEYAPLWFAEQPVLKVGLTDRMPDLIGGPQRCWVLKRPELVRTPAQLPLAIFLELKGGRKEEAGLEWQEQHGYYNDEWVIYQDAARAIKALSAACVNYGRSLVNLSPVDWATVGV